MGNKQFTVGQIVKHKLTGEKFIVIQNHSFLLSFKVRRVIKKPIAKLQLYGSIITYDDYVEESFFDPNEFESCEGEFRGA